MTVNPYTTPEYAPQPTAPTPTRAAKSDVGEWRSTNRLAIAGALFGVVVGLWMGGMPDPGGLSDYEFGHALGITFGQALGFAITGFVLGWLLRLFFTRPRFALFIVGGAAAIGGVFAARRGLPSMASIPTAGNAEASTNSITSASKPIDLARHREARRVQYADEAYSVILPPNWKETGRESDAVIYVGSTGVAFFGCVGLKAHPKPSRLTFEEIQDSIAKNVPGFVSLIEHGRLTIDEKQALFVAYHVRLKGRNLREVMYLVPGESKLYELTVCCDEPPTASSRNTLTRVVNSVRVD